MTPTLEELAERVARLERLDEQFATITAAITKLDVTVTKNRDEVLNMRDVLGTRHEAVMAQLADIKAML